MKIGGQYEIVPLKNLHTLQKRKLLTDAELGNNRTVALDVVFGHIVQQAAALTNHFEQTLTAVIVLLVHLQVLGELVNALGEDGDLHLRRAGVALVGLVVFDDGCFLILGNHDIYSSFRFY